MASLPEAKKLFCPHCNTLISKSTWYRHYSQYYDSSNDTWKSKNAERLEADFDFGSDSSDLEENDNALVSVANDLADSDLDFEDTMETVLIL